MKKSILLGVAISSAFLIGIFSANPIVEAVGGWQPAVDGLDARITALEGDASVYEVSVSTVILADQTLMLES